VKECKYVYCRTSYDDHQVLCPLCGFPDDATRLKDPAFLNDAADQVTGLPPAILDMHQILPAMDRVVEQQVLAMQKFGIKKALLQSVPVQAKSLYGNDKILELAQGQRDRFWASQFIDPRQTDALESLRQFDDSGVKVVKLIPPAGYFPDDPKFARFWETMNELGLVAMVHTGFITARHKDEEARAGMFLNSRYADPIRLDLLARQYPGVTFILCHMGGGIWYEGAAQMVTQHENVWGDTSGSGLFALKRLLALNVEVDWKKIFWGNDSPPFAYPFNFRLHLAALQDSEHASSLISRMFHENGRRFSELCLGA
jgi:predicted TIM-barrel fold metal-dependent hydrolase